MSPEQFQEAIDTAGLSQRATGRLLGHDERTVRKWVAGKSAIPPAVAIVLRLLASGKITLDDVTDASSPRDRRRRGDI
jgi:DNA-binding transcriptional regulator YiaG